MPGDVTANGVRRWDVIELAVLGGAVGSVLTSMFLRDAYGLPPLIKQNVAVFAGQEGQKTFGNILPFILTLPP